MMHLGEKLQNGATLADAWANSTQWESKWSVNHHTKYSLQGSGEDGTSAKPPKKGKKRGAEEISANPSDNGWQSKYDSMRTHADKLQKMLDGGKAYGKGKGKKSGGGDSYDGTAWGSNSWNNNAWPNKSWKNNGYGGGKNKGKK